MDAIVITWRELLLVVVAILAINVAEMLLLTRQGGERVWRFRRNVKNPDPPDLGPLTAEVATLRDEVERISAEIREMKTPTAASPYGQAIQYVRQGMDAGQIAANCGISRGEAELLVALHRSQNAT